MNIKHLTLLTFFISINLSVKSQSFEVMSGHERLFIDAQYLKFFSDKKDWSLFSRARATTTYSDTQTDLFMAGYLNYTTQSGFGATLTGRISSFTSGLDIGPHFNKRVKSWSFFIYPSIKLNDKLLYSWFSIIKYRPQLNEKFKLYTSAELFSFFNKIGHISNGQRIRIGLDRNGYQFGFAINLRESGNDFSAFDSNVGAFVRKQF